MARQLTDADRARAQAYLDAMQDAMAAIPKYDPDRIQVACEQVVHAHPVDDALREAYSAELLKEMADPVSVSHVSSNFLKPNAQWGLVVYRGSYSSDAAWERMLVQIRHDVDTALEGHQEKRSATIWSSWMIEPGSTAQDPIKSDITLIIGPSTNFNATGVAMATGGFFFASSLGTVTAVTTVNVLLQSFFSRRLDAVVDIPNKAEFTRKVTPDIGNISKLTGELRKLVVEAIGKAQSLTQGTDAWTTAFLENHDLSRSVSRLTDDHPTLRESGAKMLAVLQTCLSGTQYIYQGQEIGAVNAPKETYPLENYRDISSCLFIEMIKQRHGENNKDELDRGFTALQHLARDHSRIPMAWNSAAKYGGFSEEAERAGLDVKQPWMKPHPLSHEINVAAQVNNPDSVFGFWRKMLLFRKQHEDILVYGDYLCLEKDDVDIYIFMKQAQDRRRRMMVVLNFTSEEKQWAVPESAMLLTNGETPKLILTTCEGKESVENLAPFEGRVYIIPNNVLQSNL